MVAPEQTVQQRHQGRLSDPYPAGNRTTFREPLTVVTDKGDPAWTAKIRSIIATMKADGTLRAITIKWYGKDYSN